MSSEPTDVRALLGRSLQEIRKLKAEVQRLEQPRGEAIAIVGIGCRLPGGVSDVDGLWELLRAGRHGIVDIPPSRFRAADYYDPDPDAEGKMYTTRGGFLDEVAGFDAAFFGITAREAASMDPQHRLLLEVAWEALEDAGIAAPALAGSRTGVFVGITNNDYGQLLASRAEQVSPDAYFATGNPLSFAAGRLSYVLGLQGPALALDSACSSSLAAVHLACQSLRSGESDRALAAGVNLILAPGAHIVLCRARMLARDGFCKTFDAAADGYSRGEGVGVLVLERLADALRNGDRVYAVIRGSALNQDGASGGITVPSGSAQQRVIAAALDNAGVEAHALGYVEAHGTGTQLGDPIEVRALAEALCAGRTADNELVIGSIKTNLGHLEAAAGIVGLIKAALVVQHGLIPAHLHFETPSPHIPWRDYPLHVPRSSRAFPVEARARLAGVSSFGASGTNAHVIVEQPPARSARPASSDRPVVIALSAATPSALSAQRARFVERLNALDAPLDAVAAEVALGRRHFDERLAFVCRSRAEACELASDGATARIWRSNDTHTRTDKRPRTPIVAWLFTGQGSQVPGMGRDLFESEPVFRASLERSDAILQARGHALLDLLYGTGAAASDLSQTSQAQPALVALEIALCDLYRSFGVEPDVVLGHSLGEYVALYAAGVLEHAELLELVLDRALLMQQLPPGGAMLTAYTSASVIAPLLTGVCQEASIAALLAPDAVTIAGRSDALEALALALSQRAIRSERLAVSHAFHSALIEPMLPRFRERVARVSFRAPRCRVVSNLTGAELGYAQLADPSYWVRHAREPVQLASCFDTLERLGVQVALELGPKPALLALLRRANRSPQIKLVPSLRADRNGQACVAQSLANLYTAGVEIAWQGVYRAPPVERPRLHTYPFEHARHWFTPLAESVDENPLVGRLSESAEERTTTVSASFTPSAFALLRAHRVFGSLVASGVLQLALVRAAAAHRLAGDAAVTEIEAIDFEQPLVLSEHGSRRVRASVRAGSGELADFTFESADSAGNWTLHSRGRLRMSDERAGLGVSVDLEALLGRMGQRLSGADFYDSLWKEGAHQLGEEFRLIEQLWFRPGEALARLVPVAQPVDAADWRVLEARVGEACGQILKVTLPEALRAGAGDAVFIGQRIARSRSLNAPDPASTPRYGYARLERASEDEFSGDVQLLDADGRTLAVTSGFLFRRIAKDALRRAVQPARSGALQLDRAAFASASGPERERLLGEHVRAELRRLSGSAFHFEQQELPLRSLGLDSLMAVELRRALELGLDVTLDTADFLGDPTVASLVRALQGAMGDEPVPGSQRECTPTLGSFAVRGVGSRPTARTRLVCLPFGGAGASVYRAWAASLPDIEVCPIQLPGREDRLGEPPATDMQALVSDLTEKMQPLLDRPFAIYGCSMGALIGYELAHSLERVHKVVPVHLFVAACAAPGTTNPLLAAWSTGAEPAIDRIPSQVIDRIRSAGLLPDAMLGDESALAVLLPILRADFNLVESHRATLNRPLSCPITALGGRRDEYVRREHLLGWSTLSQVDFALRMFPGGHLFMESDRSLLLRHLEDVLARECS